MDIAWRCLCFEVRQVSGTGTSPETENQCDWRWVTEHLLWTNWQIRLNSYVNEFEQLYNSLLLALPGSEHSKAMTQLGKQLTDLHWQLIAYHAFEILSSSKSPTNSWNTFSLWSYKIDYLQVRWDNWLFRPTWSLYFKCSVIVSAECAEWTRSFLTLESKISPHSVPIWICCFGSSLPNIVFLWPLSANNVIAIEFISRLFCFIISSLNSHLISLNF